MWKKNKKLTKETSKLSTVKILLGIINNIKAIFYSRKLLVLFL